MPKCGTKMPYLRIFGLEFEKNTVTFEISIIKIELQNFWKKTKMPKFGIINALFEYFLAEI